MPKEGHSYKLKELQKLVPLGLREARKRSGLTVRQAATKIEIKEQTLQIHEEGRNLPQLDVFLHELAAYGLDFASFHQLLLEVKMAQRIEALEEEIQALTQRLEQVQEQEG
jgi:DNA-binding XRE family transcriptional regulator